MRMTSMMMVLPQLKPLRMTSVVLRVLAMRSLRLPARRQARLVAAPEPEQVEALLLLLLLRLAARVAVLALESHSQRRRLWLGP